MKHNPNVKAIITIVVITLLVGFLASPGYTAGSARSANKKGLKQYDKEQYDQALTEFIAGSELAPDRPELKYNQGTALYKNGNFKEAVDQFQKATVDENATLSPNALYNMGNSYYRAGQAKEAIDAYKRSLMKQADHLDAKHNLEMALRLAEIQEQQQEQQQDQQQQKQEQQQPEDQNKQPPPEQPEKEEQQPSQGEMTEEQADRLLDAMQNEEQNALKDKLQRQFGRPKRVEKDW